MNEDAQRWSTQPLAPASYGDWSVADFAAHVAALKAEILRAEAAMAAKKASLGAASAFFRTP